MGAESSTLNKRRSVEADTLAASVVILLLVTVVQRTIGFGRGVLVCRWMSPEGLGEWEMVYSFLMTAAPLAVLGVPGSFGRYAEHYRQRGHLRTFLHRSLAWTVVCALAAVVVVEWFAAELSVLIFGSSEFTGVMRIVGVCLVAIILHHTLNALLTALRLYRIVSAMNFAQSFLFAALALAMLWRSPDMLSVLYGYTLACLLASTGALIWAWPALHGLDRPQESLVHSEFWSKLLRFAFFVWITNLLTHLFAVVDRYMLVHYAAMTPAEALDQIGHYHASRIIPLLMVSVAELLTGMVMPHLSHDWEAGRRAEVSSRLNLAIKLTAMGMLMFGACVIAAGPLLFNVVLEGRYALGLAVLPWAVAGCVLYSVYLIAQNYLWCAEKNWLQAAPLALGLTTNIVLNLALLPTFGLYGCVISTACGAYFCLATVLLLNRRHGMTVDRGVWLLTLAPLALGLGVWPAVLACGIVSALSIGSNLLFTSAERHELKHFANELASKSLIRLRRLKTIKAPGSAGGLG
jgi:O-antigen/teichoic acid export membrane protein